MFGFLKISLRRKKAIPRDPVSGNHTVTDVWKNRSENLAALLECHEKEIRDKERAIEVLQSQIRSLRKTVVSQEKLDARFADLDSLSLEELIDSLSRHPDSSGFSRAVFYLIKRRENTFSVSDSDDDLTNSNRIIFKNGALHGLQQLREDLFSLITQFDDSDAELRLTRLPFPLSKSRESEVFEPQQKQQQV
ncbi:MAG: hypothetical protein AAF212_13215 [Verrucomicrobiota bacterium]